MWAWANRNTQYTKYFCNEIRTMETWQATLGHRVNGSRRFKGRVRVQKPPERKATRFFETPGATWRRSITVLKTIFLHYTTENFFYIKKKHFCLILRDVTWHRKCAVSRHVAQREISRNAGGVCCYCWMNRGSCLCAFFVHGVRIVERRCLRHSFRVFVTHVAWPV